ncbi:MAG: phBC6A51 family helix-turn-helix protein, partial [Thermodesulfobacteriota bacterium]
VQVQQRMERRGLPWKVIGSSADLNSIQLAAAVTVSNFADEREISRKLDQLGVTSAQYYAWLQQPEFQDFVRKLANQNIENVHHEAVLSFNKLIREGDFQAIRYYFELTGVSQTGDVQNLKHMIQLIIESVQKHVKDPTVLAAISADLMSVTPLANNVQPAILTGEYEDAGI